MFKFFYNIINHIISILIFLCVIAICYEANVYLIVNHRYLITVFIILVIISVLFKYIKNKNNDKGIKYVINLFDLGYKFSLILMIIVLCKEMEEVEENYISYLILFIPSILYVLDENNIKRICEIYKYKILQ